MNKWDESWTEEEAKAVEHLLASGRGKPLRHPRSLPTLSQEEFERQLAQEFGMDLGTMPRRTTGRSQ